MPASHLCVLLAVGGPKAFEPPEFQWDSVIAADHGADHLLDFEIVADQVVGDLDSISEEALAFHRKHGARVSQFPQDKDQTDLELALKYIPRRSEQELFIVGVCGGRLDHSLMNIFSLSRASEIGLITFDTPEGCGGIIPPGQIDIKGAKNSAVALLAQTPLVKKIYSAGVHWPMQNEALAFGEGRGISNLITEKCWQLSHADGALLWLVSGCRRAGLEIEWHPASV